MRWFSILSKKSFGVLVFECRLPKENSLSTCGTFTRAPIPPRNTTLVTEFLNNCQSETFSFSLLYFCNSGYYTWSNPHQLPRDTLWRGRVRTWVWLLPPTSVGIVTENPLTGRKANKCPKVLRNTNNNTKHSALMILPIFNLLNHTWAISRPPRGHKCCFAPKCPFARGRTILNILNWLQTCPKVINAQN